MPCSPSRCRGRQVPRVAPGQRRAGDHPQEHRSRLTRAQRRQLTHDRFLLSKRRRDLTPQEQWVLESWTLGFPTLAQAYQAKEDFYGLWDLAHRQAAKEAYGAWTRELPRDLQPAFPRTNHRDGELGDRDLRLLRAPDHKRLYRVAQQPDPADQSPRAGLLVQCDPGKLLYAETARKRPKAGLLRFSTKAASELTRAAADADYGADLPLLIRRLGRLPL
jgi:hypothetical protein